MIKQLLATTAVLVSMGCNTPTESDGRVDTLYISNSQVVGGVSLPTYDFILSDSGRIEFYDAETDSLIYYQGHYSSKRDTLVVGCTETVKVVFDNYRREEVFVDEITPNDSMYYRWSIDKWQKSYLSEYVDH